MVAAQTVTSSAEALRAAEAIGYPVAMKGVAPQLAHKSDLGLVRLHVNNAEEVAEAFDVLAQRLASKAPNGQGEIIVQKMAEEGVELIVGVMNQKDFGSFVMVGPGGLLVEITNQVSVRLGPVDEDEAREMLKETVAGRLLEGVRGRPAANVDAAARAVAAFSRFGAAQAGRFSALEINPLIVGPQAATGVDFLAEQAVASGRRDN